MKARDFNIRKTTSLTNRGFTSFSKKSEMEFFFLSLPFGAEEQRYCIDLAAKLDNMKDPVDRCGIYGKGEHLTSKKRIVIAEDQTILREGLRAILEDYPEFEVTGEAADGLEAIRMCAKLAPDLLLLDFSMPRMNGVEAIADIKKQCPQTKILMLTAHGSVEYLFTAFKAGADGYALKDAEQAELLQAIRTVLQGKKYIPAAVAEEYKSRGISTDGMTEEREPATVLTKREKVVLKMVAEGYSNKKIAGLLHISPKTVDNHRTNIMRKLDLHTSQALTFHAIHIGLVDVDRSQPSHR
jgi:DNA-binding NarL/FixJ family response regulator